MVARAGWGLVGDGGYGVDLVGDVYGDGVGTGFGEGVRDYALTKCGRSVRLGNS